MYVSAEGAIPRLASYVPDKTLVTIELKVDYFGSTSRAWKVERPEAGPVGLNPHTWLPRASAHWVGKGRFYGNEMYSVPAWLYRRLFQELQDTLSSEMQ